jgi:pilus assembly protein Flp/PilA
MGDTMLKAATATKVYVGSWANATAERMRRDRGQGAVEYLGVIVLVVAIILVLLNTNFGQQISDAIKKQITKLTK